MAGIVSKWLILGSIFFLIGCNDSNSTEPECSSTGTYTIISSDGEYNTDYCIK